MSKISNDVFIPKDFEEKEILFLNQIIDKKRIELILKRIKRKSLAKGIDTKVSQKIWISMIRAFIDYEFRNFGKKSLTELEELVIVKGLNFGMDLTKYKLDKD